MRNLLFKDIPQLQETLGYADPFNFGEFPNSLSLGWSPGLAQEQGTLQP